MIRTTTTIYFIFLSIALAAQSNLEKEIKGVQLQKFNTEICLDFVRKEDLNNFNDTTVLQIIIIRHGEPAMNKKGWKNREEAIRYTQMYDSVGVYDFDRLPICLREKDVDTVYTSLLPRSINTAEKTIGDTIFMCSKSLFNEFERKIINFPNIKLPRKFWSITTRVVWIMGFNHKGIESFSEAKERARTAAQFLAGKSQRHGKALLFSHGFLNKYIKRYLKQMGYKAINLDGQEYLGSYYFYKVER